jgi:hypothetical protein
MRKKLKKKKKKPVRESKPKVVSLGKKINKTEKLLARQTKKREGYE